MKHICPYSFTAVTRADQIAAILTDAQGEPRCAYDRYFFNWNVKARNINETHSAGERALDPALDAAWQEHLAESRSYSPLEMAFQDTQSHFDGNEYTSYPGEDQGDWHFSFKGRSSGHLCLAKWRGHNLARFDAEELNDSEEWPDAEVTDFYKGLVCCDSDLTPAKASKNVEYYLNWIRGQWEDEAKAAREASDSALAEAMMEARPDMYPAA